MQFDPKKLAALKIPARRQRYGLEERRLYALGIGCGIEASEPRELAYAGPDAPLVSPAIATTVGAPGFWLRNLPTGIDWRHVVHGELLLTLHRPMPVDGDMTGRSRIVEIIDKGEGRAALVVAERELRESETGTLYAVITDTFYLIGAGGFGGANKPTRRLAAVPDRAHDLEVSRQTHTQMAFLHRMSGDNNPVHTDPVIARELGYDRPILHGVSTYGVACQALVQGLCEGAPERVQSMACRFAAPVYPGQRISIEAWHTGPGEAAFLARIVSTGAIVLSHGEFRYAS